jgi:peptide chain release factor 3
MSDAPELRSELRAETARRRTFAIIAHPDAGKTTLTEKLLLYSGLLRTAGMVKNRKGGKMATSDWMKMEQERGISITASAMQFEYKGHVINVLDTPGHQDFSEDTYRTLTAADTAIMVLDAAKGVEAQTRKLFAVCKLRGIPVLTFINKCDLPGREPLTLLSEVEEVLGIQACAMNWPIGSGRDFVGVAERGTKQLLVFEKMAAAGAARAGMKRIALDGDEAKALIAPDQLAKLTEDMEMLDIAGTPFSRQEFLAGRVTPVFFGSALTNFGVEPFYDTFVDMAAAPGPRVAVAMPDKEGAREEILVDPVESPFSAYVFKIQANMDKMHRDSLAFLRICSGRFDRDVVARHYHRGELVRELRLSRPTTMVARSRTTLDVAYPGDVVGLVNAGFAIGDTIAVKGGFEHKPLPSFPPEVFARVSPNDLTKRKAFDKGLLQLASEGTVQILRSAHNERADPFVAAVGRLQFEVLQYRLRDEYGVETRLEPLPFTCSGWLVGDPLTFEPTPATTLAIDARGRHVGLFPSEWDRNYCAKQNPQHSFIDYA